MNDNINTVTEKFLLDGETEPKSIVQRVGETLNTKDLQYLNNLFVISDQENFKSNENKFFEFLNKFKAAVSGSDALKDLDDTREERLSDFKYTMYNRYINGIQSGKTPEDLLTVNSKDFIGKDINKFIPNSDFVFKNIIKKIKKEKSDTPVALPPKKKPGQTTQEYQDSKEYKDFLKQRKGQ